MHTTRGLLSSAFTMLEAAGCHMSITQHVARVVVYYIYSSSGNLF